MSEYEVTDKCICGHYGSGHNSGGCFVTSMVSGESCCCKKFVNEKELDVEDAESEK